MRSNTLGDTLAMRLSSAKIEPLAAELRNAAIGLEQCLARRRCQGRRLLGCDGVQLAKQEGASRFLFVFFGGAIFRWTPHFTMLQM